MIDSGQFLIQAVFAPLVFSVIALIAGKYLKKYTGIIVAISLLYSTILLAIVTTSLPIAPDAKIEARYKWAPYVGDFTLVADGISAPIALTIALLSLVVAIYSIQYMEHEHGLSSYFALYSLYASGMIGTVLTTNLAAFFLFFEFMLIPSWALVGIWGSGPKEMIAFKYFMFTEAGALSLLAGIVATYSLAGTFDIFEIASRVAGVDLTLMIVIVIAILLGFFVKMAVFPLHTWLPDTHAEAPTPISALLSPAMIGIGGYAAIRIIYYAFPRVLNSWPFMTSLSILALITMVYGGLMAIAQDDLKRLLAYSSISQMGYLLFGISSLSFIGIVGSVLLYVSHGLCKAVLFMVSGIFMHEFKTRRISDLRGLASKMPYTTIFSLISFLGLAGVPPLLGFWGELFIFAGSMYTALSSSIDFIRAVITAIAIISAVLTAGYGLWTIRRVFFGEPNELVKNAKEAPALMIIPIGILATLAVILGVYPTVITEVISPTLEIVLKAIACIGFGK
ncbi:MAG: NADH-quinone oxidoreductase subunit M [Nitrososphaerota archaeon]